MSLRSRGEAQWQIIQKREHLPLPATSFRGPYEVDDGTHKSTPPLFLCVEVFRGPLFPARPAAGTGDRRPPRIQVDARGIARTPLPTEPGGLGTLAVGDSHRDLGSERRDWLLHVSKPKPGSSSLDSQSGCGIQQFQLAVPKNAVAEFDRKAEKLDYHKLLRSHFPMF